MAIYRHFADKDALVNALMDDGLAAWEQIARSIRATDPMEWLLALGEAFLEFALTQPHRFDAAFFLPAPRARQYPEDFAAGRSPVVAMALVRIEQAKADGHLGEAPALEVALAFSALAQGLSPCTAPIVSLARSSSGRFIGCRCAGVWRASPLNLPGETS